MPLADRDYMRSAPPGRSRRRGGGFSIDLGVSPLWVIIGLNFLVFIVTSISRGAFGNLALVPVELAARPWTIVTSMFVHAGFMHFFFNMLTLFFFGRYLSMLVGERKFLFVYLVGGLVGNVLFVLLNLSSFVTVVGASGAVYAVAGVLAAMRPKLRVLLYFFIPMPLWLLVVVFMVIFSFIPGVAWQAHLGGLAAGAVAGYFYRKRERGFYY